MTPAERLESQWEALALARHLDPESEPERDNEPDDVEEVSTEDFY